MKLKITPKGEFWYNTDTIDRILDPLFNGEIILASKLFEDIKGDFLNERDYQILIKAMGEIGLIEIKEVES